VERKTKTQPRTKMEKIVVISDGEPDDLIAIRMLLLELVKRRVQPENIFILSTLRNAAESAAILNEIIQPIYPTLFAHVGTSGLKKPFTFTFKKSEQNAFQKGEQNETKETKQSQQLQTTEEKRPQINQESRPQINQERRPQINQERRPQINQERRPQAMIEFISSSKNDKSVDIILIAPALDLSAKILLNISPDKIRSIWSWGGLTLPITFQNTFQKSEQKETKEQNKINEQKETKEQKEEESKESKPTQPNTFQKSEQNKTQPTQSNTFQKSEQNKTQPTQSTKTKEQKEEEKETQPTQSVSSVSASFNWRVAAKETIELLTWVQENKITMTICTPAIYQTTPAWSNFSGVTEENNPVFAKMLKENQELKFIEFWIKSWNEQVSDAVKKRCNIKKNSLQFTPADVACTAAYLWPSEIIIASEKISVNQEGIVTRLSVTDESTISFVNQINYDYFVNRLSHL
jgi:hypothetical protein